MDSLLNEQDGSFFLYDLDAFEKHLTHIKKHLHPDIKLWYATKANPLSKVLELLEKNQFGLDFASLGEFKQAKAAGFSTNRLISTGPAKNKSYIKSIIEQQVSTIVIESFNQLQWTQEIAREFNIQQKVLLRVQLDWNTSDKSVLGGSGITPFGLGVDDWKQAQIHNYPNLDVIGFHCFQWGNVLDVSFMETVWTFTIAECLKLASHLDIQPQVIDLGGGLGISYDARKPELEFTEVQASLLKIKNQFGLKEIWLELGRYLMGNYGSYFTRIEDIKSVRGHNLIVTQGGINHLARPALTNDPFPCRVVNRVGNHEKYRIHGPLCTALDFLGEHLLPSHIEVGEWLEFYKVGAYGFTESMPYFLCHEGAREIIKYNGSYEVIRQSDDLAWMR